MAEWSKKRRTMRHYDRSARVYDVQYYKEQEAKIKTALVGLPLEKQEAVLDAGCGTGILFPHVSQKASLVVGIDISALIIKTAHKRAKERLGTAVIRADVDHTPFLRGMFDVVFMLTLLQNTPKPVHTLNEMVRVTKPDASIIATGLKKAFSRRSFERLLKKAELEARALRLDENFKEYVAVCAKLQRKP